ncbi:MAG: Uma2 family endonuclease [Chloroflexi bacterium]|nr:Uma2 family endonuclease [Chloroflexota bacterium]
MTQPKAKPQAKLTAADYMAMTPPEPPYPRYQLIEGKLFRLPTPHEPHQAVVGDWLIAMAPPANALGIGQVIVSPLDVTLNDFNVFQPDLLYVSNGREHIFDGHGVTGAPDVVVEILSDPTRRRYLKMKLPIYRKSGVREIWAMDLEAESVTVHPGDSATPTTGNVFTVDTVLTSHAMPGVAIELRTIFARARKTIAELFDISVL